MQTDPQWFRMVSPFDFEATEVTISYDNISNASVPLHNLYIYIIF